MDCNTPDFSVLQFLLEFAQTCLLSWWCRLTISPSVAPFFSCPQSFPASGYFPMSWLFVSGGQSIETSASASVLPMNIQGWFPLGLTGWIPCCLKGSQESSSASQLRSINSLVLSLLYGPTLTSVHDYWKKHSFDYTDFCWQSDNLYFLICCLGFVIAFLPRSKHLLISCLQSSSTVIWEPKKIKSVTVSTFPPAICHKEIIFMIQ